MLITAAIVFVFTFVYLLVTSLTVLVKNPKSLVNLSLATALLFISVWLMTVAGLSTNLGRHITYGRFVFVAAAIGVQALYLFVYYFVRFLNIKVTWWFKPLAANLLACFMIPATLLSPFVLKAVELTGSNQLPTPLYGPLYPLYIIWLLLLMVSIAALLFKAHRVSRRKERLQIQAVSLGLLLFIGVGSLTNVILPLIFHTPETAKLTPISAIMLAFFLSYAVLKHQFLEIRPVIVRALSYVLSVLGLGFLYGIVTFLIITLVLHNPVTSIIQRVVNAALAVGLAFLFQPTKRFFDKLTNRLFYRDAYDAQEVLDQASHLMVGNVKLGSLSQTIMTLLSDTLHPEQLGVLLVDANHPIFIPLNRQEFLVEHVKTLQSDLEPLGYTITVVDELESSQLKLKGELQAAHINLVVPLKTHQTTIGYLLCGDKLSGSQYDRQDLRLLSIIADGLAIAIQNALRFEEIEHFNLTLQDKVDKATHQLRHANQRLKALDETKDDFISMASHQLRTPLTTVKGYVSMVLDGDGGKITAAQRKLLSQSFSSAQRMVYLISDLLNVSRLKSGKFILESSPANLAEVVESEVSQLCETAEARGLELVYEKPAHFPTLLLDETKIRQVIMNFIDNAIYYTPSGGHITIRLTESEHAIELTVTDDGIGVPAHDRPHLFTKFYRASNARRARPDGTGLGLFMARKVIAAQGGAVVFRSQEGKGSTFGFTLAKATLKTPRVIPGLIRNPVK